MKLDKIAIIPARSGSKRIPGKNVKAFHGKPIIAYSIELALKSKLFDEVMVSTDDENIAELATSYGAKVPALRSPGNSDDHATLMDVIEEVVGLYRNQGADPSLVGCLLPTAPFLSVDVLSSGMQLLASQDVDSVFSIQKFDYPIQRSLRMNSNGYLEMIWPEHQNARSQDLPEAFHDAGQFYIGHTRAILEAGTFFTPKSRGVLLSNLEAVDIDTEEDWAFAENLYSALDRQGNS